MGLLPLRIVRLPRKAKSAIVINLVPSLRVKPGEQEGLVCHSVNGRGEPFCQGLRCQGGPSLESWVCTQFASSHVPLERSQLGSRLAAA